VLRKWGHAPVTVDNGNEAWQVMQDKDAPELAILDWEMPGKVTYAPECNLGDFQTCAI